MVCIFHSFYCLKVRGMSVSPFEMGKFLVFFVPTSTIYTYQTQFIWNICANKVVCECYTDSLKRVDDSWLALHTHREKCIKNILDFQFLIKKSAVTSVTFYFNYVFPIICAIYFLRKFLLQNCVNHISKNYHLSFCSGFFLSSPQFVFFSLFISKTMFVWKSKRSASLSWWHITCQQLTFLFIHNIHSTSHVYTKC